MGYPQGGGRGRSFGKRRVVSTGGYPAIGHVQFSFQQLIRQAIESRKPIFIEFMTGETLTVILLREDQFTLTVLVGDDIRIIYKHAIKYLGFARD